MELIVDGQGIVFYRIPRGTTLFRGDSDEYLYKEQIMRLQNQPTFFGLEQENVEENYGIAYEFVTLVELNLIALDKNQGTAFYNFLPAEYKRILDVNYGYQSGIRYSVSEQDKRILAYICDNGYDGYACDAMLTTMGGTFHSEVALCKPADKLSGGECVTDPATAKHKIYELKMRRFAPIKTKRESLKMTRSPLRSLNTDLVSSPLSSGNIMENPSTPKFGNTLSAETFSTPSPSARLSNIFTPSTSGNIMENPSTPRLGNSSSAETFSTPSPSARLGNIFTPFTSRDLSSPPQARGLFLTYDKENTSLFGGKQRTKTKKSTFRKSGAKGKIERKKRRTQKKRRNKKTKKY
jgi:hypothetical protein